MKIGWKEFLLLGVTVLGFFVATNSRREEYIFWVSRRVVGAYGAYRVLRFIADGFTKRGQSSK